MQLHTSTVATSLSLHGRSRSMEEHVPCETSKIEENFSSTYYDSGMPQYRKHHIELAFLMKNNDLDLASRLEKISDILLSNANSRNFSLILMPRTSKLLKRTVVPSTVQIMENVQLYLEEEPGIVDHLLQIIESIYTLKNVNKSPPVEPTISMLTDFYTFLTMLQEAENTPELDSWCLKILDTIATVVETSNDLEETAAWLIGFLNQMKGKQTFVWHEFYNLLSEVLKHMSSLNEMALSDALEETETGKILKFLLDSQCKEYATFDFSTARYIPANISQTINGSRAWNYLECEKKCPSFVALFEATQKSYYLSKNTTLHLPQLVSLSHNNRSSGPENKIPNTNQNILRKICKRIKLSLAKGIAYSKQTLATFLCGDIIVSPIETLNDSPVKEDVSNQRVLDKINQNSFNRLRPCDIKNRYHLSMQEQNNATI